MLDKNNKIQAQEKAVLVGLVHKDQTETQMNEYLAELAFLADTAGAVAVKTFTQKLPKPDSKTFVGKGKVQEIKEFVAARGINLVIFDDELTGSQIGNITEEIGVKTIDRSDLILDIFASRAKTAQAKVQVELAQYQYLLPRLKGMWKHLERQGGGIGSRGPGETEIETDRRIVAVQILHHLLDRLVVGGGFDGGNLERRIAAVNRPFLRSGASPESEGRQQEQSQ